MASSDTQGLDSNRAGQLVPLLLGERVDRACASFEERWLAGHTPRIADFVAEFAESERTEILTALVEVDLWHRRRKGESPTPQHYSTEFPQFLAAIESVFGAGFHPQTPSSSRSTTNSRRSDQGTQTGLADASRGISAGRKTATAASAAATHEIGGRLGDYEILRELGRGGMGVVYQARHRRMQRVVALKVLSPALAHDADALLRFRREVIAAASLFHPNIVMAFDSQDVGGIAFLVMEYVPGTDLANCPDNPLWSRSTARPELQD